MKKFALSLLAFLPVIAAAQHTLHLKSGEKINGEVVSMSNGTLQFTIDGSEKTYKLTDIKSLDFATAKPASATTLLNSYPKVR